MKQQLYWITLFISFMVIGLIIFQPGLFRKSTAFLGITESNTSEHTTDSPEQLPFFNDEQWDRETRIPGFAGLDGGYLEDYDPYPENDFDENHSLNREFQPQEQLGSDEWSEEPREDVSEQDFSAFSSPLQGQNEPKGDFSQFHQGFESPGNYEEENVPVVGSFTMNPGIEIENAGIGQEFGDFSQTDPSSDPEGDFSEIHNPSVVLAGYANTSLNQPLGMESQEFVLYENATPVEMPAPRTGNSIAAPPLNPEISLQEQPGFPTFPGYGERNPAITPNPNSQDIPRFYVPPGSNMNGLDGAPPSYPSPPGWEQGQNSLVDPRLHVESALVEIVPLPGSETVARVGTEVILGCDILAELKKYAHLAIQERLDALTPEERAQIPPEEITREMDTFISQQFRGHLEQQVKLTLLYCSLTSGRKPEEMEMYNKKIGDNFEEKIVPLMMKDFKVETRSELNSVLERISGSSIEREKMLYTRKQIAQSALWETIKEAEGDCSYEEMLDYYNAHLEDYKHEAKVKWKQLTVNISDQMPLEDAKNKIIWMANEVVRGIDFEEVAKHFSDGLTAKDGGVWDWTPKGVLASTKLEQAIFQNPVGTLSPVIVDTNAVHIVLVEKREDEHYTPFRETQAGIREKMKNLRRVKKETEFINELYRIFQPEVYENAINRITGKEQESTSPQLVLPNEAGTSLHWR